MQKIEVATLANGCFWCTEAVFARLKGVISVSPGYSGGQTKNPTYEEVGLGQTGHVEALQIVFDTKKISFGKILEVFFETHDPTQIGGQGKDIGPQYQSVVFYHSKSQKRKTQDIIKNLSASKIYTQEIVTKVKPFINFYDAEDYHKNYYEKNSDALYCQLVIKPKIAKLEKMFASSLKNERD